MMIKAKENSKEDKENKQIQDFRKKEKALNYASTVTIVIPDMSREELSQKACDSWNDMFKRYCESLEDISEREQELKNYAPATISRRKDFLVPLIIRHILYVLTNYHMTLHTKYKAPKGDEAYKILRERVIKAAVKKFKWLE